MCDKRELPIVDERSVMVVRRQLKLAEWVVFVCVVWLTPSKSNGCECRIDDYAFLDVKIVSVNGCWQRFVRLRLRNAVVAIEGDG